MAKKKQSLTYLFLVIVLFAKWIPNVLPNTLKMFVLPTIFYLSWFLVATNTLHHIAVKTFLSVLDLIILSSVSSPHFFTSLLPSFALCHKHKNCKGMCFLFICFLASYSLFNSFIYTFDRVGCSLFLFCWKVFMIFRIKQKSSTFRQWTCMFEN